MAPLQRQSPDVLVGRAREVAELERALDRVVAGERCVLQVVGEPGIGKSRLAAELARRAEGRGCLVLDGRAAEFERDVPFGLIVEALNDYLGSLGPAPLTKLGERAVAELASVFPSLSAFADAARPQAGFERYRTHYAIRAAIEHVATRQPVVLLLDDVHWADAASVELIGHLVRRFSGSLLAAFAFRWAPERLLTAVEAAERSGLGIRLEPRPLTAEEADMLLDPQLDGATRAGLYRESGGNPFYLEELNRVTARLRGGRTVRAAAARHDAAEMAPPPNVAAAIQGELAELPDGARTVLEAAAVAGESFELDLVAAVAAQREPATLAALDILLQADLVRSTDAPRRFRFRHPIVRRTVYEGMPVGWRLGAHARAATALTMAAAPLAARAHHVERSAGVGDEDAIAVLTEAARSASVRAPLTAGRWLVAALRLLPKSVGHGRRLGLLTDAARALSQAGSFEEALPLLEQALPLVVAGEVDTRTELIVQLAGAKRQLGQPLESRMLLEEAVAALDDPASLQGIPLRAELALGYFFTGDFDAMAEVAVSLLATARGRGDPLLTGLAASLGSIADTSRGLTTAGLAAFNEAQAAFDAVSDDDLASMVDLCGWLALAATRLERIDEALAYARGGLSLAPAAGQGSSVPGQLGLEAQLLLLKGQVNDAVRVSEMATDAVLGTGNDQLLVWTLQTAATAATWAGEIERAVFSAREAVVLAERVGEGFFAPLARLVLAGALHAGGDAAGAQREIDGLGAEPAAALLDLSAGRGWELLARTHLELGDVDAAEDVAHRAYARAAARHLPQQMASAQCARAAVLLARGDAARAAAEAGKATARAATAGNPLLAARARSLGARAASALGDRTGAITELERALAVFMECGAHREADAAARELRRLGRRVPRRTRVTTAGDGLGSLSAREREVADHVAAGKTNRAVAETLYLSEKTVETHLGRIYGKLGIRSRVALTTLVERERATGPYA